LIVSPDRSTEFERQAAEIVEMSYMGHVLCRTCKLTVCLGKLRRDESGRPVGFAYAGIDDASLGSVVLRFMAEHIKHDLIVAGDDVVYEMDTLCEYDSFALEGTIGGVLMERRPCEPSEKRRGRLESGWKHPAGE
jgi:hypothetical protein